LPNSKKFCWELDRNREVNGTVTLAASTTVARYFVPRIFIRFHHYHLAAALDLIVGNTEEVLDHLRQQRVGLGLVEGHQRSPGVRLEQFLPDEIVPVCTPRIPDPKLRRALAYVARQRYGTPVPFLRAFRLRL
jgi:DNA-binding transcriptional LysR family regulator